MLILHFLSVLASYCSRTIEAINDWTGRKWLSMPIRAESEWTTCKEIRRFSRILWASTITGMIYVSNLHTIELGEKQVSCVSSNLWNDEESDGNDLRPISIVDAHPLFLRNISLSSSNIHMVTSVLDDDEATSTRDNESAVRHYMGQRRELKRPFSVSRNEISHSFLGLLSLLSLCVWDNYTHEYSGPILRVHGPIRAEAGSCKSKLESEIWSWSMIKPVSVLICWTDNNAFLPRFIITYHLIHKSSIFFWFSFEPSRPVLATRHCPFGLSSRSKNSKSFRIIYIPLVCVFWNFSRPSSIYRSEIFLHIAQLLHQLTRLTHHFLFISFSDCN